MATSTDSGRDRILTVRVSARRLTVDLLDGRSLSVPLAWFPRLHRASPSQRRRWELCGGGRGIHWPALDEDISVEGLLRGAPAPGARGRTRGG